MEKNIIRLTILTIIFALSVVLFSQLATAAVVECWQYATQSTCNAQATNNCVWITETHFGVTSSWCERVSCFSADHTNSTYCQTTLNTTYNISCAWSNGSGQEFCDPTGGDFFGNACTDFNGNQVGCFNTFYCLWNSSDSTCKQPVGGFTTGGGAGAINPSCGVVSAQDLCINISGCSWNGTTSLCSGNNGGIQCNQLNKTICSSCTFLSTCCNWNGTKCGSSFDKGCYDNMGDLPTGASFCEDTKSFKNQTLCEQIAGSPWYMPCKWDNSSTECHFNSQAFGDFAGFDEIGSQVGCEAQGGTWKSTQYNDPVAGVTKTDTWCEFNFGSGGNCASSCWACEKNSNATSLASAKSTCDNSPLGYCKFTQDSNAANGYGWCNPTQQFIDGGAKSCSDECGACQFLTNPESKCLNSTRGCVWLNDSNAPNGVGFCYGENENRCANDCFSCYTSTDCSTSGEGGNGACSWDNVNLYCKPVGFNGEVCFDGQDNDNDGKTDCADADCSTDKFCGGDDLNDKFGDCPTFTTNVTCTSGGCAWLRDDFESTFGTASSGHCDFPGAQCWQFDSDQTACSNTGGCIYVSLVGGTCEENGTLADSCFPQKNQTACETVTGCAWNTGGGFGGGFGSGGWCEPVIFTQCFGNATRRTSQAACEANVTIGSKSTQVCAWSTVFNTQGECEPVCFSKSNATCLDGTNGLCEQLPGLCEPTAFGGNCVTADGNKSKCEGLLNGSCTWFTDTRVNNNVTSKVAEQNVSGFCDPKGEGSFVSFMGNIEPTFLGDDGNQAGINDSYDLGSLGLRDDFERLVLGSVIQDFTGSGICNGIPLKTNGVGSGNSDYTFFWYVDADGNTTNNCASRDNSSLAGFEFSFKYQGNYTTSLVEVKSSYQCVNGSWGAVPIPLTSDRAKMCSLIGGGMAGIDKGELNKFKSLYNKSKNMRLYATVSNITTNDSFVVDVAGPYFYSPGAFDFRFEDCSNSGGDSDGDGITATNDPDCFNFLKFGFVPNEAGFQCKDSIDNDADGLTDCDDAGCSYDSYFCGGVLQSDANDKTAPKITWFQADAFIDSAYVSYDTNEPSNGTLSFYNNDSTCKVLNKTIRDSGLVEASVQDYKLWHDGPVDNFDFNVDAIGSPLKNATAYYFKTTVCDISGNCAVSACSNFTTKGTVATCKSCSSTFNFPFTPPSGSSATDPLGNLTFKFKMPDGTESNLTGNSSSGVNLNYTQTKNFDLVIENPTTGNSSTWRITLINASITGKVSTGVQNFTTGTGAIGFNSTTNGTFVGLGNTKCQELINTFRPKKLEIGIPGNITDLWQCNGNLGNCVNKTANATRITYNSTKNITTWRVPAEWGC